MKPFILLATGVNIAVSMFAVTLVLLRKFVWQGGESLLTVPQISIMLLIALAPIGGVIAGYRAFRSNRTIPAVVILMVPLLLAALLCAGILSKTL